MGSARRAADGLVVLKPARPVKPPGVSPRHEGFWPGIAVYVFPGRTNERGKHQVEQVIEGSPGETLADTDEELDRALARAIRELISGQIALIGDSAQGDL